MKNNKFFNLTGINFKNPNTLLLCKNTMEKFISSSTTNTAHHSTSNIQQENNINQSLNSNNINTNLVSKDAQLLSIVAYATAQEGTKNNLKFNSFLSKFDHSIQNHTLIKSMLTEQLVYLQKKGSRNANSNMIGYTYSKGKILNKKLKVDLNKIVIDNVYKVLLLFFKSMYCLISKPVIIFNSDVIKIQLFYFVCLPNSIQIGLSEGSCSFAGTLASGNSLVAHATNSKNENEENLVIASATNNLTFFKNTKNNLFLKYDWFTKSSTAKNNLKLLAANNIIKVYPEKFEIISYVLGRFFKKPVEFELIRLNKPYYDSNIFVNYLALLINKRNISVCINRFFNKNIIQTKLSELSSVAQLLGAPTNKAIGLVADATINNNVFDYERYLLDNSNNKSFLSGMSIKISGRLMREPIIPRITSKNFEKGFTAKGKTNYSDVARFTHKNRKGAFTITVKSGQKF